MAVSNQNCQSGMCNRQHLFDNVYIDTIISCAPLRWSCMSYELDSRPRQASNSQRDTDRQAHSLDQGPTIESPGHPRHPDIPIFSVANNSSMNMPNVSGARRLIPRGQNRKHTVSERMVQDPQPPPIASITVRPKVKKNDPLNVLQSIMNDLKETKRKPITSPLAMAGFITNCCANLFDEHRVSSSFQVCLTLLS